MSSLATRAAAPIAFTFAAAAITASAAAGCYIAIDKEEQAGPVCGGLDPDPSCGPPRIPEPDYAGPGGVTPRPGESGAGGSDLGAGASGGQAAGPDAPLPRAPAPPATCAAVTTVSRFSELMIVDPAITADARADNQAPYRPWSFRERIEALVPGNADAAASLADAWLAQWASLTEVPASTTPGAARIPVEPRPAAHEVLRCPWLRQSRENACDLACATCRSRRLDLGGAPFRLLAIVNRADVAAGARAAGAAAAACGADGGELRFIYGAADPLTTQALPFTVIFEYRIALRPGETLRDWMAAWHELVSLSPDSGAFAARLDAVVSKGLARATLRRVLTNEVAFAGAEGLPWEMRQFVAAVTDAGTTRLVEVAVSGTPRMTVGTSAELGRWIDDNATVVLSGDNPLPATLLAATAPIPTADFAWRTAARDPATGAAFNGNTCNGCHGGRPDAADVPFQHVAPPALDTFYGSRPGPAARARLSRFLHDPGRDDELARRERATVAALCTPCGGPTGAGGAGY